MVIIEDKDLQSTLGRFKKDFKNILIFRDPLNLIASRYQKHLQNDAGLYSLGQDFIQMWEELAREVLGETNKVPQKIIFNYNKWIQSIEYREDFLAHLQLSLKKRTFESIPTEGGGSSFDGSRFKGNTEKMKTTERWKSFSEDSTYIDHVRRLRDRDKFLFEKALRVGNIVLTERENNLFCS